MHWVADAVVHNKTRVIDVDLKAYFDTVRHDILLGKVAERVKDDRVMWLLRLILKVSGKRGVPQGGVILPLLSNIYLNEVDKMLEKAKIVTSKSGFTHVGYARFADDLVVLVDGYRRWDWLVEKVYRRLLEEFARVDVTVNEEKTRLVDLMKGESFSFLGFGLRSVRTLSGKSGVLITPRMKARTNLLRNLKEIFQRFISQPVGRVIELINPKLRGWVNYFRMGHSSRCFQYVKDWVEKKIRRHLMRARKRCQLIGIITLEEKPIGKRSAGNPHAAFDVAGNGEVPWRT